MINSIISGIILWILVYFIAVPLIVLISLKEFNLKNLKRIYYALFKN